MIKENKYSDIKVGQKASITKKITEKDIDKIIKISGDTNPIHMDDGFARKSIFKGRIAHGLLIACELSALYYTKLPGFGYKHKEQKLKFLKPIYPDDIITAEAEVTGKPASGKTIEMTTACYNQDNEKVFEGSVIFFK